MSLKFEDKLSGYVITSRSDTTFKGNKFFLFVVTFQIMVHEMVTGLVVRPRFSIVLIFSQVSQSLIHQPRHTGQNGL